MNVTFPRVPDTIAVVLHSTGETINQLTTAITIKTNCTVKILNCDNNKFNLTNSSDLINIAVNITEYIQPRLQYNVTVSLSNCIGTTNSSHYYIIGKLSLMKLMMNLDLFIMPNCRYIKW